MREADRGEEKSHEVTDEAVDDVTNEMTDDVTEREWCLPTVTDSTGTASSPQRIVLKLQLTGDQVTLDQQ